MKTARNQTPKIKAIMEEHSMDLLDDVTKYGWEITKEFHSTWLQQIECERATWEDNRARRQLRATEVHTFPRIDRPSRAQALQDQEDAPPPPTYSPKKKSYKAGKKLTFTEKQQGQQQEEGSEEKASSNTRACSRYQNGTCTRKDSHGDQKHICLFCLRLSRDMHAHQSRHCRRKDFAAQLLTQANQSSKK
jgi:hypothetical protein